MGRRRYRLLAAILLSAALLFAAACGDDDDEGGDQNGVSQTGDVGRYCELSAQLDEEGTQFFTELERDPNATEQDFERAEREFVEAHEAQFDEIQEVAPLEIRDQVETLIAATRGRAGLGPEVEEAQERPAEQAVNRFEKENCPASPGGAEPSE